MSTVKRLLADQQNEAGKPPSENIKIQDPDFRRIPRTAIDAVRAGQDPKGIQCDQVKAAHVVTSAGSVLPE